MDALASCKAVDLAGNWEGDAFACLATTVVALVATCRLAIAFGEAWAT